MLTAIVVAAAPKTECSNFHWLYPYGLWMWKSIMGLLLTSCRQHTITFVRILVFFSFVDFVRFVISLVYVYVGFCCILFENKLREVEKGFYLSHLKYADNFPFISLDVPYNLRICINWKVIKNEKRTDKREKLYCSGSSSFNYYSSFIWIDCVGSSVNWILNTWKYFLLSSKTICNAIVFLVISTKSYANPKSIKYLSSDFLSEHFHWINI